MVVGVFDGLHLGHHYLLRHLISGAEARGARPTVITFDHHPDEVLTGKAPPLLLDPRERLERLADAGVAVTVVQHFDQALRQTPYDAFVEMIRDRVALRGFLMTPDAAFGYERRGTPETLAQLGGHKGFEVVVIPPFMHDGRPVRSSEIRTEIAAGNLTAAAVLLGRTVTLTGIVAGDKVSFELPVALPPDGSYPVRLGSVDSTIEIRGGSVRLGAAPASGRITLEFVTN
jgi:riboflavin kinase/FMN adenylyltransferase